MTVKTVPLPLQEPGGPGYVPHYPGTPPGGGEVGRGGVRDVGVMECGLSTLEGMVNDGL